MKRIAFFRLFAIALSLLPLAAFSQGLGNPVSLRYAGSGTYYLVERSNWSKYENGAYIGLTHRETRANVTAFAASPNGQQFSGFFYVLEETLRDMSKAARGLDETLEAAFTVLPDGRMRFTKDPGYPALREFPVYPETAVRPGDRWQAAATRIVDPRNDGKRSALPIMVEYEFVGQESWHDRDVYRLRAKFATRVNKYLKAKGDDQNLKDATGTHDVDILVDAESGAAVLILDRLDETFTYADGSSVRYRGNTALFTEAPVPLDDTTLIPKIAGISSQAESAIPPERKSVDDTFAESPRTATPVPSAVTGGTGLAQTKTAPISGTRPDVAKAPIEPIANAPSDASGGEPFTVEKTPQGIKLSVRDVRFAADSDAILPEEAWRIDAIAEALKLVPGGKFLVEGHTASVGKPEGERLLSIARAKKITDELVKRGLLPEQFMYSGYGGTKPVADNATSAGRAQNRRVEITILE